jgi:hypothetical protein
VPVNADAVAVVNVESRYDPRVSESLVQPFPARLAAVVTDVVASLPEAHLPPAGSVTQSLSRTWPGLIVADEPVVIPYRIYNPEPYIGSAIK